MNKVVLNLATIAFVTEAQIASNQAFTEVDDTCKQGSDFECSRYGSNTCCAHIQYTFKGDRLDFHGCANRYAIENVDGNIYDNMGFVGSWYCDSAIATAANIALTVTAGMMFVV